MFFAVNILLFCLAIYFLNRKCFSYWTSRSFPQVKPTFLIGNAAGLILRKESIGEFMANVYKKHKHERFIGIYIFNKPILIINDPVFVQNIFVKNFTSFHDHSTPRELESCKYESAHTNLFNLNGQNWRDLRVKMSPVFTANKMKIMFPGMHNCGKTLTKYMEENINTDFDMKDMASRFLLNIILTAAFGIDNDTINERESIYYKMAALPLENSLENILRTYLIFLMPNLFIKLKMTMFPKKTINFACDVARQAVEYREKNNVHRVDMLQQLIQLKNEGYLPADRSAVEEGAYFDKNGANLKKMTQKELEAQVVLFFVAGFETTSLAINYCLFELARNPMIQQKVHDEIDNVLGDAGEDGITYESLHKMKYIECCVEETLRKYPPVAFNNRMCTKDFQIPDTKLVIERGTILFIPTLGIQHDPNYFDDPLQFKPERFLNSSTGNANGKGLLYMPFGDGPRFCIANRMAKVETKLAIAFLLSKFTFELVDKNLEREEVRVDPLQIPHRPLETIFYRASLRRSA